MRLILWQLYFIISFTFLHYVPVYEPVQNFFLILTTSYFSKMSEARPNYEISSLIFLLSLSIKEQHRYLAAVKHFEVSILSKFLKKKQKTEILIILSWRQMLHFCQAALKILMFTVTDSEWHMAGCHREKSTSDRLLTIIVQTKEKLIYVFTQLSNKASIKDMTLANIQDAWKRIPKLTGNHILLCDLFI